MEKRVVLPCFDGMWIDLIWDPGSNVNTLVENNTVIIQGNKMGLHSIAKQMLYFSSNSVPPGAHVHFETCPIRGRFSDCGVPAAAPARRAARPQPVVAQTPRGQIVRPPAPRQRGKPRRKQDKATGGAGGLVYRTKGALYSALISRSSFKPSI